MAKLYRSDPENLGDAKMAKTSIPSHRASTSAVSEKFDVFFLYPSNAHVGNNSDGVVINPTKSNLA